MSIVLLIVGLLLVVGLIVVHELGHFLVARRNGVDVEEFGIFFPPRLYSRKTKGGWTFSINLLPLGGFVKLKGEHDSDTEPGTFGAAKLSAKTKILLAGVTMNLIVGVLLFTILAEIGMPQLLGNQFKYTNNTHLVTQKVIINDVVAGSPAAHAGLKVGDQLTEFSLPGNQQAATITKANDLRAIARHFAGKVVAVHYVRGGQTIVRTVKFLPANSSYELGIATEQLNLYRSTWWSAPIEAVGLSGQLLWATIVGLGHAIGGLGSLIAGFATHNTVAQHNGQSAATANIAGPVGIFAILQSSSIMGYQFVLFVVAYLSLVLALMNILPIPVVDGGRLYITLISRWLKRPLSAKREEAINFISAMLLLVLFVLITIVDVKRFY